MDLVRHFLPRYFLLPVFAAAAAFCLPVTSHAASPTSHPAAPAPKPANASDRVVAVVNDQVITSSQLNARVLLNLRQAGLALPTPEQKAAVAKRTLSLMIDEELQRQFADKAGLGVSDKELAAAKQNAENGIGKTEWAALTHGAENAASDKLAAEMRWQKIMTHELRPRVNIGTAEVDRLIEELAKSRHVLEREISMIQLAPTNEADEKAAVAKLDEIKEKISKGSDFSEMAKTYSEDKSAVNGGKLGWFTSGELNPQLEEALDKLQPGQVSDVIRTPLGWHLIRLDSVRTTKPVSTEPVTQLNLYLLAATATSDTSATQDMQQKMAEAIKSLRKVDDVKGYFDKKQYADVFTGSTSLDWVGVDDLQPEVQTALRNVKVGQWTGEVRIGTDFGRIYVAGTRQTIPQSLQVYRERVSANLLDNRMELAARRFMRELRQRAFVDVRL